MTAGPPSGGRPPLTDAKPLVFTGIHSRVGIWSIVFSVVFLTVVFRPLSYSSLLQEKSDGGLDIGTIMLLIQIVPLAIGGLVGIVFILRHRQRLRVDANGFRIRTGRRFRTLSWDQVRGNLAVSVIPLRNLVGIFDLKPLLLPVITVEGERIELPCLMGDPYYERRAHQRVERAMAAIAARDPGPGAGPVAPSRPDGLVLTEHRDDKGTAFILLGSACSCWGLAWRLWRSDYADALTRICAGVLVVLGLAALMFALHGSSFFGLRPDNVTVVDASGLRIRRGWRRRSLSWEQVRGHLEARVIPPNGKGGLRRGGPWSWGWRAQVHYRDGERDVPLAGASLMAWDEASALQLASERIGLLRSYDPDPAAAAWSRPAAPAYPPAVPPAQYGAPAPQPAAPAHRPGGAAVPAHPSAIPPVQYGVPASQPAPPAQYGIPAPRPAAPAYPPAQYGAPSDDSWREPGSYGRPASAPPSGRS